jgi:hypothetical protein
MKTSNFNDMMLPFCRTTSHAYFHYVVETCEVQSLELGICAYCLISKLYWFIEKLARQCFSVYVLCCFYF